jgi:hypothetical protein
MTRRNSQLALIDPPKQDPGKASGTDAPPQLTSWALVEIFGHQRIVGWMTVDPPEFPGMIRVDVPDLLKDDKIVRPGFTRYFGRAALYGVTPIDEGTVRKMLPHVDGTPGNARPYSLREDFS